MSDTGTTQTRKAREGMFGLREYPHLLKDLTDEFFSSCVFFEVGILLSNIVGIKKIEFE